jgi:hypothetical protein
MEDRERLPRCPNPAQRQVGLHVIDLAVLVRGPDDKWFRLAVFCMDGDGPYDQQDKDLAAAGYRSLRYSREEIGETPGRCAGEVAMAIDDFISPRKHRVA